MDQSVSASHACGHACSSGVKWPHDTPGAPAAGEKRPYPDGSKYIQPQLAPAGAIDVTSRAAPRPTGGPITQRETQRPADGFPNADSERCSRRNRGFRSAYRSPDSVRLMHGWVTVPVGARLLSDAALVPHVPGLAVSAATPALGSDQGTKALCMMPCRARLMARCSLPRKGTLMPGFDAVQAMLANLGRSGHLLGGTPETNRINQPNVSSPGGSHDVAFGKGSAWTHWLTSA
jgi:hypothetical protein